jgi:hypothetical protein
MLPRAGRHAQRDIQVIDVLDRQGPEMSPNEPGLVSLG